MAPFYSVAGLLFDIIGVLFMAREWCVNLSSEVRLSERIANLEKPNREADRELEAVRHLQELNNKEKPPLTREAVLLRISLSKEKGHNVGTSTMR
jgi:hypothetical protein